MKNRDPKIAVCQRDNFEVAGENTMNNNFPLNRFDFSDLVKDIHEMNELPDVLTDVETGIEFYGVNSVTRDFLIRFLKEFNLMRIAIASCNSIDR